MGDIPKNINDDNIRDLLEEYFTSIEGGGEPRYARLNNWDVSNVTNMSGLFMYNELLTEPLNNWRVYNVTNMSSMFDGCTNFNQPLDDWYDRINNVNNMMGMFANTRSFLQDLHTWNIPRERRVDVTHIFANSRMQDNLDFWPVPLRENRELIDWRGPIDADIPVHIEPIDMPIDDDASEYEALPDDPAIWDEGTHDYTAIIGKKINRIKKIQIIADVNAPEYSPINDLINGFIDPHMLHKHMKEDKNLIIFKMDNTYFIYQIDTLEELIDTNKGYGLVLFCKESMSGLDVTPNDVYEEPIYFNLKRLGFYGGYINASEIQGAINHSKNHPKTRNNVYILSLLEPRETAIATVSWRYLRDFDTDASSATHCNPGSGGPVYTLSVASFTVTGYSTPRNHNRRTSSLSSDPLPVSRMTTRSMHHKKGGGNGATRKKYKKKSTKRNTNQRKRRKTHKMHFKKSFF